MDFLNGKTATDTTIESILTLDKLIEESPDILVNLRMKRFTAKDTDKSFRIINFWESIGLLDNNREGGNEKWRKFSMIDVLYIHILSKLREFGFSLPKLKETKNDLLEPVECGGLEYPFSVLEWAYLRAVALKNRGNTYFIVDSDGHIHCTSAKDMILMEALSELPASYVFINFNKLLKEKIKLKGHDIPVYSERMYVLDGKGEEALLELLRTTDYNSIKTTQNHDGSILIEREYNALDNNVVADFADIVTKVQDGNVVRQVVTEKIKIK